MRYSEDTIEEVRKRNDIVDIVEQYVYLKKKGTNYYGLCPFHNEKSGSFSVSQSKQMFHCFGCGEGGDVISFLMKYKNLTFVDALKELADRAGVILPEEDISPEAKALREKQRVLFDINKDAAIYFFKKLESKENQSGMEYFRERGLSEDTIKSFGLGYADSNPTELLRYLRSRGYKNSQLVAAGIASFDEQKRIKSRFWNRVMFPIVNSSGKVLGFGGRVLGEGKPKYLNSPESLVFDKSRNLFGTNYAKNSRAGYFILCEGYMDVIAMHQAGFDMTVASLGTSFTDGQALAMKRYADTVILAYDTDEAGIKATLRGIKILEKVGLKGKVLNLSPYKDPDEFIKNNGREAMEDRINNAENAFYYEIKALESTYDLDDPTSKTDFYRKVAERLCEYQEPLERNNYIEAAALKLGVDEGDLVQLVSFVDTKNHSKEV